MSKTEKYIQDSIKNYSNEKRITVGKISYWKKQPWLTPDEARKAVEIAREEMIEWLSYHLNTSKMDVDYKFEVIEELRKAMQDE